MSTPDTAAPLSAGEREGTHPCPTPSHTKRDREGTVWACGCGRLYALRNNWNYAGDLWVWEQL